MVVKNIPKDMRDAYTLGGTIQDLKWLKDESVLEPVYWSQDYLKSFIDRFTRDRVRRGKQGKESYRGSAKIVCDALDKYSPKGKRVAVLGSQSPWVEAILFNYGATEITTIEYNVPMIDENDRFRSISFDDLLNSDDVFDMIISYSSIKNSGLGRYGDELDPFGDVKTMNILKDHFKEHLLVAVPIGKDTIYWNAHRVYGKIRLPLLLMNYKEIEWIGHKKKSVIDKDDCLAKKCKQPIIVLVKDEFESSCVE